MRRPIAFILCLVATPALAEWRYVREQSAFEATDFRAAITVHGDKSLAVRCLDNGRELVFATQDTSFPQSAADTYNASMPPDLLLRIDGGESQRVKAKFMLVDRRLGVVAPAESDILAEIENAKTDIAVAIDMLNIMHETRFDPSGSAAALAQLKRDCPA